MNLRVLKLLIFLIIFFLIIFITVFYLQETKNQDENFLVNKKNNLVVEKKDDEELKEKIGQMLLVGFRGTKINENSYIARVLKEVKVGGVILFDFDVPSRSFPRNIVSFEQTKELISQLKEIAPFPIFVAVDVEGGEVNRLKRFISFSSPAEIGKKRDYQETERIAGSISFQLATLGFNLNFAPVVDLNINPQNPIIGALGRSFSGNPQEVIEQSKAFINGFHKNNIISVIKHFPGHGSSAGDSHFGLVDVTETYNEKELIPFKELIKTGMVDAVMTAHLINKKVDPEYPATLSVKFLQEMLRKEMDFQGIIISDDMQMGAIIDNFSLEKAVIQAIKAGCDLLIFSNNVRDYDEQLPYKVRDIVLQAVKNGVIKEERIDESFQRIIKLKRKYKIIN